jgi:hypothetical protein
MPVASRLRKYLRLPGGIALLLGLGAISAGGAAADAPDAIPQDGTAAAVFGGVRVRAEGEKIYLFEGGRESELRLGATRERAHLLRLLEPHRGAGVTLHSDPRLIMSGGGGAGFSLRDITKSVSDKPASANKGAPRSTAQPNLPKQETGRRDSNPPVSKRD